jgi:tryptophan synthase beta subunit
MLGAEVRPAKSAKNTEGRNHEAIRDWINNPVDTIIIVRRLTTSYPDMVTRFQSAHPKKSNGS